MRRARGGSWLQRAPHGDAILWRIIAAMRSCVSRRFDRWRLLNNAAAPSRRYQRDVLRRAFASGYHYLRRSRACGIVTACARR